jgi:uncharacterized protein (TIGR02452 family)
MSSSFAPSAPAAKLNKADRAKLAKETISKFIPHILKSNIRAQDGVSSSELIQYSPPTGGTKAHPLSPKAGASSSNIIGGAPQAPPTPLKVSVTKSDTFDAVQAVITSFTKASRAHGARVAALNMASEMRAGGGVLNGAVAQEEALCLRSTLYPSLSDSFYRIPENAAIYTPDVLVFRGSNLVDMPKADWFFTDVISCAAIRRPDVVKNKEGETLYEVEKDREVMTMKVRLICQVAKEKGITHLVLGALGCGAFRNPPEEVARIFKKVLLGDRRHAGVEGIEEVVFAIFDEGENLRTFRRAFEEDT